MLDEDFCLFLEFHLTATLSKSKDIEQRRCWCDGVFIPEADKDFLSQQIEKSKAVSIKAWIDHGRTKGKELGQSIYELKIFFGEKSLECSRNKQDLKECVPGIENQEWLRLDKENKILEIQLL